MDNVNICVEVTLTEKDIYNYQKVFLLSKISIFDLVAVYIIILLYSVGSVVKNASNGINVLFPAILLIIPIVLVIMMPFALKKGAKNALATNKILQKPQRYEISPEGFSVSSDSGLSFIKWDELYKASELKESMVLFISEQQAHVIPKRCLSECAAQLEILREYMKNAPVPKKQKRSLFLRKGTGVGCLVIILLLFVVTYVLYSSAK